MIGGVLLWITSLWVFLSNQPRAVDISMHVAVIPARAGSVGLPGKNRMFFDSTADFIASLPWIGRTIVSTDDGVVAEKARERNFDLRDRPAQLAGPAIPIKAVFADLIEAMDIDGDDLLWLFYLPILHKNPSDFEAAREIVERRDADSLCAFVPARTHPYSCWSFDAEQNRLCQYIPNDVFRRQDMAPAWSHHHYVACFRASALASLNNELIGPDTHPFFLDAAAAAPLIEVDTPEDLARWQARQAESSQP